MIVFVCHVVIFLFCFFFESKVASKSMLQFDIHEIQNFDVHMEDK